MPRRRSVLPSDSEEEVSDDDAPAATGSARAASTSAGIESESESDGSESESDDGAAAAAAPPGARGSLKNENLELLLAESAKFMARPSRRPGSRRASRRTPTPRGAPSASDDESDDAAGPGLERRSSGRLSARQAQRAAQRRDVLSRSSGGGGARRQSAAADDSPDSPSSPEAAAAGSARGDSDASSDGEEAAWDGVLLGRQMADVDTALADDWEPLLKGDVYVDTVALDAMLASGGGSGSGDWMRASPDQLGPLGLVLQHWETLKDNCLFTTAAQWKARLSKHGSRYTNWDSSDFTVRMMTQKWLRKMKDDVGGFNGDLGAFWANGDRYHGGRLLGATSDTVQEYNRLLRSLQRRPAFETSDAIAALNTSDESESDEEMYGNFVANDDSADSASAGSGEESDEAVDEHMMHHNLEVQEALASADSLIRSLSGEGRGPRASRAPSRPAPRPAPLQRPQRRERSGREGKSRKGSRREGRRRKEARRDGARRDDSRRESRSRSPYREDNRRTQPLPLVLQPDFPDVLGQLCTDGI